MTERSISSGTILYADDEVSIRKIAARMLEHYGFCVIVAADGQDAINIYREQYHSIDLVILDLSMPNIDGSEAFREIKKINPTARVMLASGYHKDEIAERFAGQGLTGVLEKPFSLDTLEATLLRAISAKVKEK